MPASPNLLISPQEKAAASDTQLSQAGLLPRENNEGRREAASEMRTRPLFLRPGGPRLPLQQLAARAVKRRPPGSPALCPSRLGPHPLECTWAHLRARPFVPETPGVCHHPLHAPGCSVAGVLAGSGCNKSEVGPGFRGSPGGSTEVPRASPGHPRFSEAAAKLRRPEALRREGQETSMP